MKPLAVAIRMYQRWAPARMKADCPGPSQGQLHCSAYGLELARELPARVALPRIAQRLESHTRMPAWTRKAPRWASVTALAGMALAGSAESASNPANGINPGPAPTLPYIYSCPAGLHVDHSGHACVPNPPPPQNS